MEFTFVSKLVCFNLCILIYIVLCISDPVTNLQHKVINDTTVVLTWGTPVKHDTAHPVPVINCNNAIKQLSI